MNGAGSRRKGQTYERELRHFFDEETKYTSVDSNRSGYDGDDMRLEEFPWLSVEAKNHATMTLPAWLKQAREQCKPEETPVVIHKRKGKKSPGEHYVTMELNDFVVILNKIHATGSTTGNGISVQEVAKVLHDTAEQAVKVLYDAS